MPDQRGSRTTLAQRAAARLRLYGWLLRPVALLVLSAGLLGCCYLLFRLTQDGGFGRELVSATIGAVVTLAVAGVVALLALRHRVAARREKQVVRRFSDESWRSRSMKVGAMTVPRMSIVVSCTQGVPWTARASCSFRSTPARRPRHELVAARREDWLSADRAKAAELGLVFEDLPGADLLDAQLEVRSDKERRWTHYSFEVGETTYYEFASTALKLDRPVRDAQGRQGALRDALGGDPVSILDVGRLPVPAAVGSGTVVVTSDQRVLLGVRLRTFVAGRGDVGGAKRPVHVVAEGLAPSDVDADGNFSPREGARRALAEELHVGPRTDHVARVTELVDTGLAFDQERWQPYFTFLARLDRSWAEVETGIRTATDSWESEMLVSLPFDIEHAGLRLLLQGRHPDLQLASNHAVVAVWFALLYQHGFEQMRNELTS